MLEFAQLVIDYFTSKELQFETREIPDGGVVVHVPFKDLSINMIFNGEKGEYLSFYYQVASVPDEKLANLIVVCNKLNSTYKWLKFYVDDDKDIMAQDDAILTEENAGDETFELLFRGIKIVNDVKPIIMKAIYA